MRPHPHGTPSWLTVAVLAAAWSFAGAASAAPVLIDVHAGALQDALTELARETRADILFSPDLVQGLKVPALKARLTPEQAVARLLAGSDLGYRVTPDGVFVLFDASRAAATAPDDGAIAEVLVPGRRTQNADIRRTENDIQPYAISTPRELTLAPQDNVDQFLRERLPANSQVVARGQEVTGAAASNSAIDLRGVGLQRTLVLVDGRRMPGLPTCGAGFEQSDINAIPLGAIERVETLTATAGGIHGPGAIGGVVNLVLKRDYRGADFTVVSGVSSRGDAARGRIEARIGFTPDDGRTDVMLSASYAAAQPLTVGQRDYARRSLELQARNNPSEFLIQTRAVNAVTVRTAQGEPLRLSAAYGGGVLNGAYSFLPLDFQGTDQEKLALLAANAGRLPTTPATRMAGDDTSLVVTPEAYSLLFSVRRRLGEGVEAFVDGIGLHDGAESSTPGFFTARTTTLPGAPGNPFANAVAFTYPLPDLATRKSNTIEVGRLTGGVIADAPRQWRVSADYTVGRATIASWSDGRTLGIGATDALRDTGSGARGSAPILPLGDYAALQAATLAYVAPQSSQSRLSSQFTSGVARAAGPVLSLPGGPLTATLLAEVRRERMPEADFNVLNATGPSVSVTLDRIQRVASGYVELRAPLLPRESSFAPLRGLELQLALRRDDVRTRFPDTVLGGPSTVRVMTTISTRSDVFTFGARAFPADWLMLRASAATGRLPPDISNLQELGIAISNAAASSRDPKRGGRPITADGSYVWGRTGWHGIDQEKALTRSIGVVFNPTGERGPRLSLDASRVEIRDEIGALNLNSQQVIDAENLYPGQVVREPLSAADAALGYTAGRILAVYTGLGNIGRTVAETVDAQLDWKLPPVAGGETELYGSATWQPTLRTRRRPGAPWLDRLGYRDGPLKWRGVGGVQWTRGPLLLDLNAQYLHHSSPLWSPYTAFIQTTARNQGSDEIPSRVYVNLTAQRRFDFAADHAVRALEVRASVQNLFDTSPPIVADPSNMGYDYRSDPRRRRFELSLSTRF